MSYYHDMENNHLKATAAIISKVILYLVLALGSPGFVFSQEEKSQAILQDFKNILSFDRQYRVTCEMATFIPGQKPSIKKYTLFNMNDKTLLIFLKPERDYGKKILMIKDQLWQYFPKIQKTIVINSSMLIGGSVNLTDIVSSSLFQFYKFSEYSYEEKTGNHILTFTAAGKTSPYGKVKYFYSGEKINHFEAYARSGILLKKIFFLKYETNELNQNYPVQIKIVNALQENDYSLIQMSSFEPLKVPDFYFNPSAMNKAGD